MKKMSFCGSEKWAIILEFLGFKLSWSIKYTFSEKNSLTFTDNVTFWNECEEMCISKHKSLSPDILKRG